MPRVLRIKQRCAFRTCAAEGERESERDVPVLYAYVRLDALGALAVKPPVKIRSDVRSGQQT
jgi:hypothetical protein